MKMAHLNFIIYLIIIFGNNSLAFTDMYRDNMLGLFYLNNDCLSEEYSVSPTTSLDVLNSTCVSIQLAVTNVVLTKSLEQNMKLFCAILAKNHVVALLLSPGAELALPFLVPGNHFETIPSLHVHRSVENNQKSMHVNMIPPPKDSVQATIDVFRKLAWFSVAVVYNTMNKNVDAVLRYKTMMDIKCSIVFFQITSGLPTSGLIRQVAELLANIKLSRIHNIVVYANGDELHQLFLIGDMMQMTGAEYTWILSWQMKKHLKNLPSNSLTLRPKNMNNTRRLWSDSCEVITRGFREYMKRKRRWIPLSDDCFSSSNNSFVREFYRYILRQSFVGKTGSIAFNEKGNRVDADYELVGLKTGTVLWHVRKVQKPLSWRFNKNHGRKQQIVRAVTALTEPFASVNNFPENDNVCGAGLPCRIFSRQENISTQFCCDGMVIELLHVLQIDLELDIRLHISKDNKYGAFDPETQKWNGMIGELLRGEADMAIADLTITDERARVVEFTQPFMEIGSGVMVRTSSTDSGKGVWGFLKPVAFPLWVTVILSIFIMGIIFWTMEKITFEIFKRCSRASKDSNVYQLKQRASVRFSLGASLHYSWTTIVRTRDRKTIPSTTSAKIGAIGLALCFLVFITTYTAQLAAFLVTEEHVLPITHGIQDSKLQNPPDSLKMATRSGTSTETSFRESSEPLYRNIWKNMGNYNIQSMKSGIEYLKSGKIDVYFDDYTTLVYHATKDKDCALRVLGKPFFKSGYGIALPKNSAWTSIFSQKLLEYQKHDHLLTLTHRWLQSSCKVTEKKSEDSTSNQTFHRMSPYDLSGLFIMVCIGMILGAVLLPFEGYFHKRKCKKSVKIARDHCQEEKSHKLPPAATITKKTQGK